MEGNALTAPLEVGFLAFYVVELGLKLYVHRRYFFLNDHAKWNMFDLVLVSISVTEQVMLPLLGGEQEIVDVMVLRLMRLFKMAKVLRMLRALQFVRSLRLFVRALASCGGSLIWGTIIIFVIIILYSLLLVQSVHHYVMDAELRGEHLDAEFLRNIHKDFGSV